MPYVPAKGKTLLIPSGTEFDPRKQHLFIVLTDCCALESHLLVSLSRIKAGVHFDDACVFEPGAHPFVKQPSFVAYRLARIARAVSLIASLDGGYFTSQEDMLPEHLGRIAEGVERSRFIAPKFVSYFHRNWR